MKLKTAGVMVLALLVATMFLGACIESPSAKRIGQAAEKVKQETVAEKELLYDNGKNFLVVFSNDWAVAVVVLQDWSD